MSYNMIDTSSQINFRIEIVIDSNKNITYFEIAQNAEGLDDRSLGYNEYNSLGKIQMPSDKHYQLTSHNYLQIKLLQKGTTYIYRWTKEY